MKYKSLGSQSGEVGEYEIVYKNPDGHYCEGWADAFQCGPAIDYGV